MPEGQVRPLDGLGLADRSQQAGGLAGEAATWALAETEPAQALDKAAGAEALGDLPGADVAGEAEDVAHAEHPVRAVVANHAIANPPGAVLAVEQVVRRHGAVLQCDGDHERLERAPRLEAVDEGTGAVHGGVHLPKSVGVERGALRQRQQVTVARVEGDQAAVAGPGPLERVVQRGLRDVLQMRVECQCDARPPTRLRVRLEVHERIAARVANRGDRHPLAAQRFVEG